MKRNKFRVGIAVSYQHPTRYWGRVECYESENVDYFTGEEKPGILYYSGDKALCPYCAKGILDVYVNV